MAYYAIVTNLKNLRPHPNADRLQLAECFGNTVCVDLNFVPEQLVVYFPADGQLSIEFAEANNLLRKKDENGNDIGGYMDPDKRNIKVIKLRGEKSDGLCLPISCLKNFGPIDTLKAGDRIDIFNGHEICQKYIPRKNPHHSNNNKKYKNNNKKKKANIAPLFKEHVDTEQLAYNLSAFKPGDLIEITLKMHGTSQRTGYLPAFKGWKVKNKFFQGFVKYADRTNLSPFVQKCVDIAMRGAVPVYDWDCISGTRRVVLDTYDGGFYGSNEFREQHSKTFEGKLWKGETVYYEVVGFTTSGAPIMGDADNKKLNDKDFVKQYGKTTTFSYGCHPNGWNDKDGGYNSGRNEPQSDIYVYRMTMTNEDGDVVEYTPDFMRYRCEQMGVKTVPVFTQFIIPEFYQLPDDVGSLQAVDAGEYVRKIAEDFYDGPDPIGKTHVREGVVVRIVNRPKFCAYKHKNFSFKVLENIIKVDAIAPDMEEAQEEAIEE